MDWYYVVDGQQVGPVSEQDLKALVDAGTVTGETLVWHEGMENWVPQNTVAAEIAATPATHMPAGDGPIAPPAGGKSTLSLREEPAATAAQPAGAGQAGAQAGAGTGTCRECGRQFPLDQMIEYEGATICAECKPAFFQRLQEGAGGTGGATPNAELMSRARAALSGSWGLAIGFLVVYQLLTIASQFIPFVGNIAPLLITGPLMTGSALFFITLVRGGEAAMGMLFHGFTRFGTTFLAYLLMTVYVLLWSLLLIVPGIIAAYAYSMTFYVLADDESCGANEAIRRSKEMMQGNKWKFFCLNFRFVGWALLCLLTLGIGFLWLAPYMAASFAEFYEDVKQV
jgi:uncharacterized membrane protein